MSRRELVEVVLDGYEFSFDVVKLPEDGILDKLSLISKDTGLITRLDYQDFLYMETVVNLNRLFRFIAEITGGEPEPQLELRNLAEEKVYEVNPGLDPKLLVITKSGVIRPAGLAEGVPLTENPDWNKVDENNINPFVVLEEYEIIDEPEEGDILEDEPEPPPVPRSSILSGPSVKKRWERLDLDIEIKKFSKDDVGLIFDSQSSFSNEIHYKAYIISRCVVKSPSLFALIQTSGLIDKAEELPKVTDELFNMCIEVNPFLNYKDIDFSTLNKVNVANPSKKNKKSKKPERKSNKTFSSVTKAELLTLSTRMKAKVIGQDEAIDQIVETIQIASCGLRDPEKPIAVHMFCGKTGIGKTYTSKVLAEELCGSREAIVRIDCSEYGEAHSINKLIGSPPSYVGYEDGGFLTNAIQEYPFSIVLFDEIEKAHSKLFDLLLQIMDDSRLTDGKGNVTSFKDCIILFTSNIGVAESEAVSKTMGFGDDHLLTDDRHDKAIKKALKDKFRPEFLNRIDSAINFRSLTRDDALKIVDQLLNKLSGYLANKSIKAEFSDSIRQLVFEKGFSTKFGARPLERAVEKHIVKPLSQMILKEEIKEGASIKIDYKKEGFVVKQVKRRIATVKPKELIG